MSADVCVKKRICFQSEKEGTKQMAKTRGTPLTLDLMSLCLSRHQHTLLSGEREAAGFITAKPDDHRKE